MSEQTYNEIGLQFAELYGSSIGQMFGKPCLKINNKAFVAYFKEQMVFKIGSEAVVGVKDKYIDSVNWDPSGKKRPMKDWIQVPAEYNQDWTYLAKQAMEFVEGNK